VGVALDGNMPSALWALKFSWQKGRRQPFFLFSLVRYRFKQKNSPIYSGSQVLLKTLFASGEEPL